MTIYTASVDLEFLSEHELRSVFQQASNALAMAEQAAAEKGVAQATLVNIQRAMLRKSARPKPR